MPAVSNTLTTLKHLVHLFSHSAVSFNPIRQSKCLKLFTKALKEKECSYEHSTSSEELDSRNIISINGISSRANTQRIVYLKHSNCLPWWAHRLTLRKQFGCHDQRKRREMTSVLLSFAWPSKITTVYRKYVVILPEHRRSHTNARLSYARVSMFMCWMCTKSTHSCMVCITGLSSCSIQRKSEWHQKTKGDDKWGGKWIHKLMELTGVGETVLTQTIINYWRISNYRTLWRYQH